MTKLSLMPEAPADRGPLLSAKAVTELEDLRGLALTPRWVRENVRPFLKLSAQKHAWYKRDVLDWFASLRQSV